MNISFSPHRDAQPITVSKAGDVLTINGETFDFSPLPDASALPVEAIGSAYFAADVARASGVLSVNLAIPFRPSSPESVRFPAPIIAAADGPLAIPTDPQIMEGT